MAVITTIPIDPINHPAATRLLVLRGNEQHDEKVLEWSPDGQYVKIRGMNNEVAWRLKSDMGNIVIQVLVLNPPVVA